MTGKRLSRWLPRPETILIFMACALFSVAVFLEISGDGGNASFVAGAVILLVFAFIYRVTRFYRQYRALQYFHILSFFSIPAMVLVMEPEIPYPGEPLVFGLSTVQTAWLWIWGIFCVLGQLAFLFNVIAGIRRGYKTSRHA